MIATETQLPKRQINMVAEAEAVGRPELSTVATSSKCVMEIVAAILTMRIANTASITLIRSGFKAHKQTRKY